MRALTLSFLLFYAGYVHAQDFISDSSVMHLVERHRGLNKSKMSMPGYRLQLYFGSVRNKAQAVRSEFLTSFPDTPCYLLFQQPHFKVRVGDFRTRQEAAGFRKKISALFPSGFIVPDEVRLPSR